MTRLTTTLTVCAALSSLSIVNAQSDDPHELMRVQRVTRAAMQKIAPSIVRVETFGGTRKMLAGGGRGDGASRPKPKPKPKPKEDDDEKKDDKKKIGPLVMPGFLQAQGATSGIVLTSDGWILISRFAVNFDPTTILITLPDGRAFNAVRGGEDTSRGIALVKIEAQDLPVPEFVPTDEVRVGQWAFALGRTFGDEEPSVHMGIVSATRRLFGRALQIDAYTSPANYGGPVIDVRGRVVGMSVPLSPSGRDAGADWYDSGIGFASNIADMGEILDRLKEGETLHRGFLGIRYDTKDLGPGVLISEVTDDSPAKAAGIQKGDRIVELDGVQVRNSFHMLMLVASKMGGDPLQISYRNEDGKAKAMTVFLADIPAAEREEKTKKEESFTPPWHDDEEPKDGSGR